MEEFTYLFALFLKICLSAFFVWIACVILKYIIPVIKICKHNPNHGPIDNTIFCIFVSVTIILFAIWMISGAYYILYTESIDEFLTKFVFWKEYKHE